MVKPTLNYRLAFECNSCELKFYLWDFRKADNTSLESVKCPTCKNFATTRRELKFEVEKVYPQDQPTAGEFVALTWAPDKYLEYLQRTAVRELRIAATEAADYATMVCREDFDASSAPFKVITAAEWLNKKEDNICQRI